LLANALLEIQTDNFQFEFVEPSANVPAESQTPKGHLPKIVAA